MPEKGLSAQIKSRPGTVYQLYLVQRRFVSSNLQMAASMEERHDDLLMQRMPSEEDEQDFEEVDELIDPKSPEELDILGLLLLTCPSLGLQVYWFLLQSSGTPYLRSLGLDGASISIIWALGPIFGAFVQPILGSLSDEIHHPLCRRKPFMMGGSLLVMLSTLAMACAQELTPDPLATPWQPRALAVVCLVVILLALSAYSVGVRAIVVDNCPPSQQFAAAAWSMRWNVLGSATLSTVGFVAVGRHPDTDPAVTFRTLACVAAVCSAATVGLVCWFAPREATPRFRSPGVVWVEKGSEPVCTGRAAMLEISSVQATQRGLATKSVETQAKSYPLYASLFFSFGTLSSTLVLTLVNASSCPKITLPRIWFLSQVLATASLLLTFLLCSTHASLALICFMGATWTVTMWVPFALINAELAELRTGVAGVQGLHNMAVSLPQIASALVCAAVLGALRLAGVDGGAVWLLRLAAVPVAWSAWLIWRLDGLLDAASPEQGYLVLANFYISFLKPPFRPQLHLSPCSELPHPPSPCRPQGAGPKGNYWGSPYPVYTLPGKEAQFQVPGCYHFIVKPSKDCTSYEMKKHEVTKDCPRYKDLPWEITVEPALVPPLHGPGIKIRKKAPASAKVPEPKPKGRSSSSGGKDETTSITTDQA
uniref:General alpha-glucoside permease n=1 Tax=Pyricularia oryzae (strain P131) TaxID=1143193 RepID=L7JPI1_PYRO1